MSKPSILIVEDEHIVAMDIRSYLERNDYEVAGHADHGQDAIKKAGELIPDLILMDISLKGEMDGIEAAAQILALLSLPIIFLTAFSNQSVLDRARLIGPHGYILKPFEERELIVAIDIALYKHAMERKLRESENKFRSVIEHASDGIVLSDNHGNISEWNSAMEQITGLKSSDVIGKPASEAIFGLLPKEKRTPELMELNAEQWNATVNSGYVKINGMAEYEIEIAQGVNRTIQSNEFGIDTPQGKLGGVIVRDITERKRLEETEREQRKLSEALLDTAMALNSTLKLDDVLDRILHNIGKLVPYDVAMVSLIEGDKVQKIRYHTDFQNKSNRLPIGDIQANLLNIPILSTIIKTRQPYLISDVQKDSRWQTVAVPGMQRVRSMACVPIETDGNIVGIINIISATPDFFSPVHTERIMVFASQAAVAFKNASLFEQAERLSLTDQLTELFNMRYFLNFTEIEFKRSQRYERTISIAMLDIDYFKSVNDAHGHGMGDIVLREVAARIKKSVRTVDVVARFGGEEFVVLMLETDLNEACQVAERVRRAIADNPIENNDIVLSVTLSLGVAEMSETTKNLHELLKCADKALYKAKANGRNRVEGYAPEDG